MTTFASDSFTDSVGTLLQSHQASSGQVWTKASGGGLTYVDAAVSDANRLRAGVAGPYLYSLGYDPASADYAVQCTALIQSIIAGHTAGPVIRALAITSAKHNYVFADVYPAGNQFRLYGVYYNSFIPIGTYTPTVALAAGQSHALELRALGDAFALLVGGVARIAGVFPAIASTGRPGVRGGGATPADTDATGVHLDDLAIVDFSTVGSITAPTLSSATAKIGAVDLAWTSVSDPAKLRYIVEYKRTADSTWLTAFGTTATTGRVYSLTPGTSYDFRVRTQATDLTLGSASNVIAATPNSVPAQPAAWNSITGTHSGSATVNQASLTTDSTQKSVDYAGGKTTFPDDAAFDVGAALTVRAICKPDTVPSAGTRRAIVSRDNGYHLKMNGSSLEGTIYIGTTPITITAAGVFVAGTTADPAMTYDGTTLKLWNKGTQVASQAQAGAVDDGSAAIVIGSLADGTQAFDGKIQMPEVLAEALAADRLAQDALALP
jgi:hypothetical protein